MRSILSLVVGYAVLAVVLLAGFALLGGRDPWTSILLVFGATALAGAATARLAPSHPRGHALLLGLMLTAVAFAALFSGGGEADPTPLWARLAIAIAPIPAAALGARASART